MDTVKNSHDLSLPDWGPYTKRYIGISHIPDVKSGLRFDLSVFPGFYRRKINVPNVMWESGYHPWEASPDLNFFSHRHELEWKDRVYVDISFSKIDDNVRLIRCECVNNTESYQNLVLHFLASMNYPCLPPYSDEFTPYRAKLTENAVWVDGLDYAELSFGKPYPVDYLVPDGLYAGEVRGSGFVKGSGLGRGFGENIGDRVSYRFTIPNEIENSCILFRYRVAKGCTARFTLNGLSSGELSLTGTGEFTINKLYTGKQPAGEYWLTFCSEGTGAIELDGFVVAGEEDLEGISFEKVIKETRPQIIDGRDDKSLLLKYADSENFYGIAWDYAEFQVREIISDELDSFMPYTVHKHTQTVLKGAGDGHFTNVFLRPVVLEPNSSKVICGIVCTGSRAVVEKALSHFGGQMSELEAGYLYYKTSNQFNNKIQGDKYLFSVKRMAATTLTNVVYPVFFRRSFIRHNTPGRWWDCLYTWDSGFIGLGLLELDIDRAIDCLNTYLTKPGDRHGAFIHHGSPVPTQFYLFQEIWNRTQSRELLKYFYPRLRQYYLFLSGRLQGSTTRQLKSNMLKTWDYFYNSGGWDDYPPQVYVHKSKIAETAAPVINTAQCIMTAKIMAMAAGELGLTDDICTYKEDIEVFTEALQKYSWDKDSGYFSYVLHDDKGEPTGIMSYEDGSNYNMGLDGVYPLIAGICSQEQEEVLINKLFSSDKMWTKIGISTVDQSAPYYKAEGYWNGAVWIPHQWFVWKSMLDLGRAELAFKIADTALNLWKNEVEASYNCYEHFIVKSGRGAGWHQFGGLSAPILCWYFAYYSPGMLTAGFNVWTAQREFSNDCSYMKAWLKLSSSKAEMMNILVSMNPDNKYKAYWNGNSVPFHVRFPGTLEILIPYDLSEGELIVESI